MVDEYYVGGRVRKHPVVELEHVFESTYMLMLVGEDTSHITKETLEGFVGTANHTVRRLEGLFSDNHQNNILKKKWASLRRYARQKVRRWDEQQTSKDTDYKSMGESLNIEPPTHVSEADDDEYKPR